MRHRGECRRHTPTNANIPFRAHDLTVPSTRIAPTNEVDDTQRASFTRTTRCDRQMAAPAEQTKETFSEIPHGTKNNSRSSGEIFACNLKVKTSQRAGKTDESQGS